MNSTNPTIEASFSTLVLSIGHSAKVAMGDLEHPETKKNEQNLGMAQFNIDLLSILREKTENNLEDKEKELLDAILGDLKLRFVQQTSPTN